MKKVLLATTLLLALAGCSTRDIQIGGMMCPEGYSQERINRDLRECRFYGPEEEAAALKASYPKTVGPECVKCLEEKGYEISE